MATIPCISLSDLAHCCRLEILDVRSSENLHEELKDLCKRFYTGRSSSMSFDQEKGTRQLEAAAQSANTAGRTTNVFLGTNFHHLAKLFTSMAIEFLGGPEEFKEQKPRVRVYLFNSLANGTTNDFYSQCRELSSFAAVDHVKLSAATKDYIDGFLHLNGTQFMTLVLEKKNGDHMKVVIANLNYSHPSIRPFKGGYKRHLTSQLEMLAKKEDTLVVFDPWPNSNAPSLTNLDDLLTMHEQLYDQPLLVRDFTGKVIPMTRSPAVRENEQGQ